MQRSTRRIYAPRGEKRRECLARRIFVVCLAAVLHAPAALAAEGPQVSGPVAAQDAPQAVPPPMPGAAQAVEGFSWGGYFYGIGALFLLLAVLWGVLWLMRRSGKFRFMPSPGGFPRDALRMEAQLPLGPRKGLVVVRFLNKRLLLGLSDQHITLLSEADTDNERTNADFGKSLEEAARQEADGG